MTTQQELLQRLRRKNMELRGLKPELEEEGLETLEVARVGREKPIEQLVMEESIALLRLRPVLPIKNDQLALEFRDEADKDKWEASLTPAMKVINAAIPSVGRIELTGSRYAWVGTGWLVEENILVTNRHVALEFA